jgi:hypothetical protein
MGKPRIIGAMGKPIPIKVKKVNPFKKRKKVK